MGFKIGVAIPIGYYRGTSGVTINARIEDEAGAVFGAELTLVENAAFVAVGINGYYESSFTPDAAGRWSALIYYDTVKYGQMFYDVGGGLTAQEQTDVEAEAEDALEGEDLDHLLKVAHPSGDPVADTIMDLIMNKDAGQTFARGSDSLEALGELSDAIKARTDNLAGSEAAGPFSYLDAGGEQTVYENAAVTRRKVSLEVSNRNMTQAGTFRLYRKVNGANYDLWSKVTVTVAAGDERVVDAVFVTNQHWKVMYEEDADEGAARDIPYNVVLEAME